MLTAHLRMCSIFEHVDKLTVYIAGAVFSRARSFQQRTWTYPAVALIQKRPGSRPCCETAMNRFFPWC